MCVSQWCPDSYSRNSCSLDSLEQLTCKTQLAVWARNRPTETWCKQTTMDHLRRKPAIRSQQYSYSRKNVWVLIPWITAHLNDACWVTYCCPEPACFLHPLVKTEYYLNKIFPQDKKATLKSPNRCWHCNGWVGVMDSLFTMNLYTVPLKLPIVIVILLNTTWGVKVTLWRYKRPSH